MKYFAVLLAIVLSLGLMMGCAQKPPTITKVDPAQASSAGGTEITITGTGFKTAPAPTVKIGGVSATGVKVTSKTSLKASIPPGTAGTADIVVTNAKAKAGSLPFKGFTYYADVAVTASAPDVTTAPPEGIEAPPKVSVTFDQEVDPTSVMIKAAGADGAEVAGAITQDTADTKTFDFTPAAPFKAGDYTVTVSGAKAKDTPGAMTADYTIALKIKEAAKPAKGKKK